MSEGSDQDLGGFDGLEAEEWAADNASEGSGSSSRRRRTNAAGLGGTPFAGLQGQALGATALGLGSAGAASAGGATGSQQQQAEAGTAELGAGLLSLTDVAGLASGFGPEPEARPKLLLLYVGPLSPDHAHGHAGVRPSGKGLQTGSGAQPSSGAGTVPADAGALGQGLGKRSPSGALMHGFDWSPAQGSPFSWESMAPGAGAGMPGRGMRRARKLLGPEEGAGDAHAKVPHIQATISWLHVQPHILQGGDVGPSGAHQGEPQRALPAAQLICNNLQVLVSASHWDIGLHGLTACMAQLQGPGRPRAGPGSTAGAQADAAAAAAAAAGMSADAGGRELAPVVLPVHSAGLSLTSFTVYAYVAPQELALQGPAALTPGLSGRASVGIPVPGGPHMGHTRTSLAASPTANRSGLGSAGPSASPSPVAAPGLLSADMNQLEDAGHTMPAGNAADPFPATSLLPSAAAAAATCWCSAPCLVLRTAVAAGVACNPQGALEAAHLSIPATTVSVGHVALEGCPASWARAAEEGGAHGGTGGASADGGKMSQPWAWTAASQDTPLLHLGPVQLTAQVQAGQDRNPGVNPAIPPPAGSAGATGAAAAGADQAGVELAGPPLVATLHLSDLSLYAAQHTLSLMAVLANAYEEAAQAAAHRAAEVAAAEAVAGGADSQAGSAVAHDGFFSPFSGYEGAFHHQPTSPGPHAPHASSPAPLGALGGMGAGRYMRPQGTSSCARSYEAVHALNVQAPKPPLPQPAAAAAAGGAQGPAGASGILPPCRFTLLLDRAALLVSTDQDSTTLPLFEAVVSQVGLEVHCSGGITAGPSASASAAASSGWTPAGQDAGQLPGGLSVGLSATLALDVFNLERLGWEPVLDPWYIKVSTTAVILCDDGTVRQKSR